MQCSHFTMLVYIWRCALLCSMKYIESKVCFQHTCFCSWQCGTESGGGVSSVHFQRHYDNQPVWCAHRCTSVLCAPWLQHTWRLFRHQIYIHRLHPKSTHCECLNRQTAGELQAISFNSPRLCSRHCQCIHAHTNTYIERDILREIWALSYGHYRTLYFMAVLQIDLVAKTDVGAQGYGRIWRHVTDWTFSLISLLGNAES